jgi:hypothetical protein
VVNMIPPAELVKQGIEVGQEINGFSAHVSYPASETGDKVEPVDHLASSTRLLRLPQADCWGISRTAMSSASTF